MSFNAFSLLGGGGGGGKKNAKKQKKLEKKKDGGLPITGGLDDMEARSLQLAKRLYVVFLGLSLFPLVMYSLRILCHIEVFVCISVFISCSFVFSLIFCSLICRTDLFSPRVLPSFQL